MGSMCCKKLESPNSPKLPDFNSLFSTCTEQIQLCRKTLWDEEEPEPKQRKFSASDISYPLPLGCTILPPKRPPRRKKMHLERTTSVREKSIQKSLELKRSKSIHEIHVARLEPIIEDEKPSEDVTSRIVPSTLDSPTTDEIVLNVIRAASGSGVYVPLDSPTEEPEGDLSTPEISDETVSHYTQVEQIHYQRPYFSDFSSSNLSPLEPIMESAFESLESTSSVSQVAENKRNFLATLLEENNNNNNLPSRKSSITESLREFECSLYDMLEQESIKDEADDIKWRPQIPVFSYH